MSAVVMKASSGRLRRLTGGGAGLARTAARRGGGRALGGLDLLALRRRLRASLLDVGGLAVVPLLVLREGHGADVPDHVGVVAPTQLRAVAVPHARPERLEPRVVGI